MRVDMFIMHTCIHICTCIMSRQVRNLSEEDLVKMDAVTGLASEAIPEYMVCETRLRAMYPTLHMLSLPSRYCRRVDKVTGVSRA